MNARLPISCLLSAVACLLLSGCSIPLPQAESDPTRFYVLSPSGGPAVAPAAGAPSIHLRPIEIASYLTARPIIVRRGENEIQFREFARWGEPLDLGIGRVLREELLARGAASAVHAPGLRSPGGDNDQVLSVRVLACEGTAAGAVNFRAVWQLTSSGANPASVARGDYRAANLTWDAKNEADLAAKLSDAVAGLAAEIAGALKK